MAKGMDKGHKEKKKPKKEKVKPAATAGLAQRVSDGTGKVKSGGDKA
jgi:hypothetical protein